MSDIGVLFTVPSSSSVAKRKRETPSEKIFLGTVALLGLTLFFILH